jgi:hypothetical protein
VRRVGRIQHLEVVNVERKECVQVPLKESEWENSGGISTFVISLSKTAQKVSEPGNPQGGGIDGQDLTEEIDEIPSAVRSREVAHGLGRNRGTEEDRDFVEPLISPEESLISAGY